MGRTPVPLINPAYSVDAFVVFPELFDEKVPGTILGRIIPFNLSAFERFYMKMMHLYSNLR
jgi:hypothetical protein